MSSGPAATLPAGTLPAGAGWDLAVRAVALAAGGEASANAVGAQAAGEKALDEAVFRSLHGRLAKPLWSYAYRSLGDGDLAEDLVQETFLRWLRADCPGGDDQHRKNYLYRILTHLIRDRFRSRKARWWSRWVSLEQGLDPGQGREGGAGGTAAAVPEAALADPRQSHRGGQGRELPLDLGPLLGELAPRDRQILWLAHAEGLEHRELAAIFEVREASVRVILLRARRRFRKVLEVHGLGPEVLS